MKNRANEEENGGVGESESKPRYITASEGLDANLRTQLGRR